MAELFLLGPAAAGRAPGRDGHPGPGRPAARGCRADGAGPPPLSRGDASRSGRPGGLRGLCPHEHRAPGEHQVSPRARRRGSRTSGSSPKRGPSTPTWRGPSDRTASTRSSGGVRAHLAAADGDLPEAARLAARADAALTPKRPVGALMGGVAELVGYDLRPQPLRAGESGRDNDPLAPARGRPSGRLMVWIHFRAVDRRQRGTRFGDDSPLPELPARARRRPRST